MGIFTVFAVAFAVAVVYRICHVCWKSTRHYKFDEYGHAVYKCEECGNVDRPKDEGS